VSVVRWDVHNDYRAVVRTVDFCELVERDSSLKATEYNGRYSVEEGTRNPKILLPTKSNFSAL